MHCRMHAGCEGISLCRNDATIAALPRKGAGMRPVLLATFALSLTAVGALVSASVRRRAQYRDA